MRHQESALPERVAVIKKLHNYLSPLSDVDFDLIRRCEAYVDDSVPTIGAEIEVTWSARFPELSSMVFARNKYIDFDEDEKEQFSVLCNELDAQYLPIYEHVTQLGVGRDKNQKFWEFAHKPVRHYNTLLTEMSLLASSDLLPEGCNLPLHITLGGLSGESGGYFIQMLTEIIGGTNAKRIRGAIGDMPIYERKWARKAPNGLKERKGFELRGASHGFEMRTFVFNSIKQVSKSLSHASYLGWRYIIKEQVVLARNITRNYRLSGMKRFCV